MTILMLATLVDEPFDDKDWIFEVKWDGYRALGKKGGKTTQLVSRNGLTAFGKRYPNITEELKKLKGSFVIDGEIVILDKSGKSQFQLLQNYLKTKEGTPYYYAFDILQLDGKDLKKLPLLERKRILKKLLGSSKHSHIRYSSHLAGKGKAFFKKALKKGLEGIIAKKSDSTYQLKRSRDWLKIKTSLRQEVVIGGFTEPRGSRKRFGSLLIGVYEKGKLKYAGQVGGGFNEQLLNEVYAKLKKLKTDKCPFTTTPKPNMAVTWIKPKLVCEVSFTEWTLGGKMRHPVFKGMRVDKKAKSVVREKAKHVTQTRKK